MQSFKAPNAAGDISSVAKHGGISIAELEARRGERGWMPALPPADEVVTSPLDDPIVVRAFNQTMRELADAAAVVAGAEQLTIITTEQDLVDSLHTPAADLPAIGELALVGADR